MKKRGKWIYLLIVAILIVVSLLIVSANQYNDAFFVNKFFLAVQGNYIADMSEDQLDRYERCVSYYDKVYKYKYTRIDKYCECIVDGKDGCEVYLKVYAGACKSSFLPEFKCGETYNINAKKYLYQSYQFADCSTKFFKIRQCYKGCISEKSLCKEDVCTETDKGDDMYNYSTILGIDELGNRITEEDKCIAGNKLKEYYCDSKNAARWKIVGCTYGCVEGKCISVKCIDGDNGVNSRIKAQVRGGSAEDATIVLSSDMCKDEKTLVEYYCNSDGTIGYKDISCIAGCAEGACR